MTAVKIHAIVLVRVISF